MKLFWKRIRLSKNNKGLSLVELICAVAILSVALAAIGSAMVVSAQSYNRGTQELDVQQEAQTTTNLIGNLLVDAVEATFDDTTDPDNPVLTIQGEGVTYTVTYDSAAGVLRYTEYKGGIYTNGILAEGVAGFDVDLDKFLEFKSAEISVEMKKDARTYSASYSTTARNGKATSVGAVDAAEIIMEKEVVLEPGQKYTLPITVVGTPCNIEMYAGLNGTGNVGTSTVSVSNTEAVITIGDDASGEFGFTIKATPAGAATHIDTHDVTILVRRVNSVQAMSGVTGYTLISGDEHMANAIYRVDMKSLGDYFSKQLGKAYDTDYLNPRYIHFELTMTGMEAGYNMADYVHILADQQNVDAPFIQFELKRDMPVNSKITIVGTSKHAAGMIGGDGIAYNKATAAKSPVVADSYPCATCTVIIERKINGPWQPSPINRGNYQTWFKKDEAIAATLPDASVANNYCRYMKYWEVGTTEPSDAAYIPIGNTGTIEFNFQEGQTSVFRPDKAYNIKLLVQAKNGSGEVKWPLPDMPTEYSVYTGVVGKAGIMFKSTALGINDFIATAGTESNPLEFTKDTEYEFLIKGVALDAKVSKDNFVYIVQKKIGPNNWETVTDINIQKDVLDPDMAKARLTGREQHKYNTYRILVQVKFPLYEYDNSSNSFKKVSEDIYDLYDVSTGEGIIFFTVK